jgi:electron transfer flavoprotein alpha subunit
MSAAQGLIFGGDRVHESDSARCARLMGAARELWPRSDSRLLIGSPVRQDEESAIAQILELRAAMPGLCIGMSSNDAFAMHVARIVSARTGAPLLGPVVRVREHRATCLLQGGGTVDHPLAPDQVLLVDDRYFVRRAVGSDQEIVTPSIPSRCAGFVDVPVAADAAPLTQADLVMAGGDGVTDWESFSAVARYLGATVGGSKVVCDKGLLPRDRQVGSSGSAVAPRLYLAFGISGSVQHMQGIADSTSIVAINTDANASIIRRAELALVTDANALLGHLRGVLEGEPN